MKEAALLRLGIVAPLVMLHPVVLVAAPVVHVGPVRTGKDPLLGVTRAKYTDAQLDLVLKYSKSQKTVSSTARDTSRK